MCCSSAAFCDRIRQRFGAEELADPRPSEQLQAMQGFLGNYVTEDDWCIFREGFPERLLRKVRMIVPGSIPLERLTTFIDQSVDGAHPVTSRSGI